MSMTQIDSTNWLLDVRVWYKGREFRQREKFSGGKKAVQNRVDEVKVDLRRRAEKEPPRSLKVTDFSIFAECLDFYIDHHDIAKSQSLPYFNRLRKIGRTTIDRLSKVFKEFIRLEKESRSKRTGNKLSIGATNKLKVYANAALNYATQEEKIKENPLRGIKKERETPRWVVLTAGQEKKLVAAVREVSPDLLPFVMYSIDVPCRRGEMLRAGKECFDAFSNTVEIPGSLTKNGAPCIKPVPAGMVSYFRSNPSPWLFYRKVRDEYKPLIFFLQKAWGKAVKRAELDKMTDKEGKPIGPLRVHDLRHHAVSKLVAAGNPRSFIMSVAGWKRDMLAIYFNMPEKEVARSIVFQNAPYTLDRTPVIEPVVSAEI